MRVGRVATVVLGIMAGSLITEGMLLVPYWQELAADAFFDWYAANAARLLAYFGPLEVAAAVVATAAAVLARREGGKSATLLVIAALLSIATLVPFFIYFADVNASFAEATIAPAELPAELGRWEMWHWLRTALAFAAFVAAMLATSHESASPQ